MRRRSKELVLLAACALLLACSGPAPAPVTTPAPPAATTPAPAATPSAAEVAAAELAARLRYLEGQLEAERTGNHIPGMAVAVVKDGEVILARGFGLADMEKGTKATKETIFAIGSTTKAFTATVAGMVIDEGKLAWDDPLSKHTPLKLRVDGPQGQEATLRDALSHQTGFPRMRPALGERHFEPRRDHGLRLQGRPQGQAARKVSVQQRNVYGGRRGRWTGRGDDLGIAGTDSRARSARHDLDDPVGARGAKRPTPGHWLYLARRLEKARPRDHAATCNQWPRPARSTPMWSIWPIG